MVELNEDEYRQYLMDLTKAELHKVFNANLCKAITFGSDPCPIAERKAELITQEFNMRELLLYAET